MVRISVDDDLRRIVAEIVAARRTAEDWALIESDDLIRLGVYEGGFDATEMAFCFSRVERAGDELWFQFGLGEVEDIADGGCRALDARVAD